VGATPGLRLSRRPELLGTHTNWAGVFPPEVDSTTYAKLIAPAFVDGVEGGLTRDDILDNVTLFWLTKTGVSSPTLYLEYSVRGRPDRLRPGSGERSLTRSFKLPRVERSGRIPN
jgi:hypothetical protein